MEKTSGDKRPKKKMACVGETHILQRYANLNVERGPLSKAIRERTGLRSTRCLTIVALHAKPRASQAELVDLADSDRSTMGVLMDRLIAEGLVSRMRSEEDNRRNVCTLTSKGTTIAKQLIRRVGSLQLSS